MNKLYSHLIANCYYYLRNLELHDIVVTFYIIFLLSFSKTVFFEKNYTWKRVFSAFAFSLYITIILSVTLLGRVAFYEKRFDPFSSVNLLVSGNVNIFYDVLFNVFLFIPLGFFISSHYKVKFGFAIIVLSTILVETMQLLTNLGKFEIIDLAANTIGGLIGIGLYYLLKTLFCIIKRLWNKGRLVKKGNL